MKKINNRYIVGIFGIALISLLFTACITFAGSSISGLGKAQDKVPVSDKVLTGTLPNGLRYYILENSFPENRAHLALIVNAGSVLERDDERGFAHFVEHLAFLDTARFPQNEIIEYLRSLGMRFGADVNAYTSYDETVYHFDIPVETVNGIKKIPDKALAILDDWSYAVSFNPEDVESERRVVLEEIRTRTGAMDRVRRIMLPKIFEGSMYANRHIIGLDNIIENAAPSQLKDFYDRWYTSDNMAVVFVGDFDGKALEAGLADHFNIPIASQSINRPIFEIPPPKNGNFHVEIITDPELTSVSFDIFYKQKITTVRGTLGAYRESVINYLIATMLGLRFQEANSDPQSSSTSSWGYTNQWFDSVKYYILGTSPKTGSIEEALRELLMEKESIRRYGFTESELALAKIALVSEMEKLVSEKDRNESSGFIRSFTKHFLYGESLADIEWEANAVNSILSGIGIRDITRATKNYFANNDCIIFLVAPLAETLPSRERIREIYEETQKVKIKRRLDKSLSDELMDRIPKQGMIESEIIDENTGAFILTLENGARVILKETTNKNNEIIMYSLAKGGSANADSQSIVSVNLLSEMINVSGLGPYSRIDLINMLAGKQVSLSFWNSSFYRGLQGASTTSDLKTLFEMIHLFFLMPRLDENAIAAMMDQYRTNLAHQNENPQRVFSRELTRIINNYHPLFMPLEASDIDKVSIQEARNFLEKCINPADYTFVFTGNLNPDIIRQFSSIYIASIPNKSSMDIWNDPGIIRPTRGRRIINKGVDDRSIVYLGWFANGPSDFNEQRNQTASVLSEYLDIMLSDEIREKMGGVYSISAGASVSVIPNGEYRISVYFVCNPARVNELILAVEKNIEDIIRQPINMDTFNKAKEALLMQHDRSMQGNLHIAQSYANSSVLYNTQLNRLNQRPEVIRAVRPQDIVSLCRLMITNGSVQVVLLPE